MRKGKRNVTLFYNNKYAEIRQETGRENQLTKNQATANEETKDQVKTLIIETVKKQKPETTEQLVKLMQMHYSVAPEQTTKLLLELENDDQLNFKHQEPATPTSARAYTATRKALWFWTIIALLAATTVAVFTIPENTPLISYIRIALGTLFVLFLPGYTFIRALFPNKLPIATDSENLDNIERIALSIGMSLALTPIVGLILNYTPWGIRLAPITLTLLALTTIFATAALLREHQTQTSKPQQQHLLQNKSQTPL
jgi:cation transport ATPase